VQFYRCLLAAPLLAATALPGLAQEKPVTLTGVFSSGFYATDNRNGREARVTSIPFLVNLDLSGYVGHPGFISYRVQPQLSTGAQANEAGFIGGNGLSLSTTFLGRRSFPLTLTYSNVQREQVTYGSLTRISGLRSLSHERDFRLNWQVREPQLPRLSFELGNSRDTLEPETPIIPDYRSRSRHYVVGIQEHRWGWALDGSLRWDKFASDFANPLEPEFITTKLAQRSSHYQFTAQRPLGSRSQLVLSGGLLNSRNTWNDRPFDQDMRFVNALLTFGKRERWQGSLRGGYSTNQLGTEILAALRKLTGSRASGTPGPEVLVFVPLQTRVSSLAFSGNLRYQMHRDWSLFGSLSQDNVSTPNGSIAGAEANYLNGTGGVSFNRRFHWVTLTSQYSLNMGRLDYANIRDSRLLGHSFNLTAQHGTVEHLELTGSINASVQQVDQLLLLRSGNQSADFTLARRLAGVVFRGGVGTQRSSFRDGGLDYDSEGLTFRGSVEHARVQLHYFRNVVDGNTLQALLANPATSAVLLAVPLRVILSSFRTETASLNTTPWRRLEANLSWTQGRQKFDSHVNNDFKQLDLRVGYSFRLLMFAVGYAHYEQSFLNLPGYMRKRFYVRVSRPFQVF
jgi:hypothetical protein